MESTESKNGKPRSSENWNPNTKTSKSGKKNTKLKLNPNQARNRMRERRFVVVKKNTRKEKESEIECKCGDKTNNGNLKKCVCIAYETLRASQEEFFNNRNDESLGVSSQVVVVEEDEDEKSDEIEVSVMKRRREKVLEEARSCIPEYGKVMHLVKAFEKLTCFPFANKQGNPIYNKIKIKKKAIKWELPGMSLIQPETEIDQQVTWTCSFSPSDLVLTATNLGLEQPHGSVSSSWDNSVNSNGARRSRTTSLDSCTSMGSRRSRKKQIKVTSPKPFKLRTEQRGRMKEEELTKKLKEMILEEERKRIPIAQGLPYTTDESESLVKPHVKDITIPVDLKLHSDIRAVERAEFDHQVAKKINLIEQYKEERERQQKVAEEEELKRLRKELIPKAQPMPFFDRPFIPRRSNKHPTIPRDPKFSITQHKKIRCCSTSSWNETGSYMNDPLYQQDL